MHMADALVAPAVAATMYVCSGGAAGFSVKKYAWDDADCITRTVRRIFNNDRCAADPVSAVCGRRSSGAWVQHLEYGVLWVLSRLFPVLVSDDEKGMSRGKIVGASILGCVVTLQLGAFSVALETLASGITDLPFSVFVATMQPIHLAIGLVEGLITAAVLLFVYEARPEMLSCSEERAKSRFSFKEDNCDFRHRSTGDRRSCFSCGILNPDGLEWSMERLTGSTELENDGTGAHATAEEIQEKRHFCRTMDLKFRFHIWNQLFRNCGIRSRSCCLCRCMLCIPLL